MDKINREKNLYSVDHRKIGFQQDLYHFDSSLAPGMVFWHSNGWEIYTALKSYMRKKFISYGYREVNTPQVMNIKLWEQSGHMTKYASNMLQTRLDKKPFALKPMSCPGHIEIFKKAGNNKSAYSYASLPIRIAEFWSCIS